MCNGGLGEMRYEKLPDVRLVSRNYDSDVVSSISGLYSSIIHEV